MHAMTSKERILATMRHEETDYLPLCFEGICHGFVRFISDRFPDSFERALFYLEQGIDTAITLWEPGLSWKDVTITEWKEQPAGEQPPVLYKAYHTPKGTLRQVVRRTDDYEGGDSIPLFSDHNVPPTRSIRYLIEAEADLDALEYILQVPSDDELDDYYAEAASAKKFCETHGVLLSGYLLSGVGDPLMWMSGIDNTLFAAQDNIEYLKRYIEIIHAWHMRNLEIMISADADHVVRRGWYESTDFWSPGLFRELFYEPLRKEIALCRQAGVTFDYVMNSGLMPLLGYLNELKPDMLSNFDPLLSNTDLAVLKQTVGSEMALCGGVNNFLVLEKGSEDDVERAVREAIEILAPGGGYILAPGDVVGYIESDSTMERNVAEMIAVWKEARGVGR